MRRLLSDGWFQVALVVFALGTALASVDLVRGWPAPAPIASTAGQTPASAPAPADRNTMRALTPRTPRRWLVDAANAPDADTADLAEAVANASPGDEIAVRAGTYAVEDLLIDRDLQIRVEPSGALVVLSTQARHVLLVRDATLLLQGLYLLQEGQRDDGPAALAIASGEVRAEDCRFASESLIGVNQDATAAFSCTRCRFSSIVVTRGRTRIVDSDCEGARACIAVAKTGSGEIVDSRLRATEAAIFASGGASVRVVSSTIQGATFGIQSTSWSEVVVERSSVTGSGIGVHAEDDATVYLTSSEVRDSRTQNLSRAGNARIIVDGIAQSGRPARR